MGDPTNSSAPTTDENAAATSAAASDPVTTEPTSTTDADTVAPMSAPTQSLLDRIEAAAKADASDFAKKEIAALKPEIAAILRKFVSTWQSQHGGILGKIEAHVLNAVIDSAFGPS